MKDLNVAKVIKSKFRIEELLQSAKYSLDSSGKKLGMVTHTCKICGGRDRQVDVGRISEHCEYFLLSLINKEAVQAYDKIAYSQVGKARGGRRKVEFGKQCQLLKE